MILNHFILIASKFTKNAKNAFKVCCKKAGVVSLNSSIMTKIVAFPACSRFPAKLICCTSFGLALSGFNSLRSMAVSL